MKKRLKNLMVLGICAFCLTACKNSDMPIPDSTTAPVAVICGPSDEETFETPSLLATNIKIIDEIAKTANNQNIMFSGLSLNYALAMLHNGCSQPAATQLEKFLGSNGIVNDYYKDYMNNHNKNTKNKLLISNSFWVNNNLKATLKPDFTSTLKKYYDADTIKIPMNKKGLDKVNNWISKATDGLVKHALSENDLTSDTVSILINAILMDSKWEKAFEKESTRECDFTMTDGTVKKIEGMHSEEYYYYENEFATAFRKNYDQSEFYFVGILPKNEGDFTLESLDIEGLLATKKSTSELNAILHIMLPKVDFEVKYELNNILTAMGVTQIFDENSHNFSGIYESNDPNFTSYVSKIIQNDRLIIDEDGTKAAAVTSIMVDNATCAIVEKEYLSIILDRPFVALIMDGETDEPLFVAKIMDINH